ncbi:MAG TPA: hypothetical protein VGR37_09445 [Longimicrobiaceae bacterium]|nr:hypothetical protein [Longimicrobiaceae bacterium]
MSRLLTAVRCDARLQLRNGFYHAAGFVVLVWGVLLYRARGLDWAPLLPAVVVGNLVLSTFYFVGGLVLLEKGERTLEALVVSPLRPGEYLGSKVLTLTALAVLENLLIVLLLRGSRFALVPFVAGMALAAVLLVLAGFIAVARYDSINEYILPSVPYAAVAILPLLPYFGVGAGPWVYAHPVHAALVVIGAAFQPVGGWELAYGVVYSAAWAGVLGVAARRAFRRFVVADAARR